MTTHTWTVASDDLELLALRAVEMTVLGRDDARLLIATKRKMSGQRKIARLLAGLANAAGSRRGVLLIGVGGDEVVGLDRRLDQDWWDRLEATFPGRCPGWDWTIVDIDGAEILAIALKPIDELVPARRANRVEVPWFDRGGLRLTPPPRLRPGVDEGPLPTARVLRGWIDRGFAPNDARVETYAGALELELSAVAGLLTDDMCSVTLLAPGRDGPEAMTAAIHPSDDGVGVARRTNGIEVRSTFRCTLLVAAATRTAPASPPASLQLVISLMLPGRGVPELRSLLLSPQGNPERFVL